MCVMPRCPYGDDNISLEKYFNSCIVEYFCHSASGRFKLVEIVRRRIHLQLEVYEHLPSSSYSRRRYKDTKASIFRAKFVQTGLYRQPSIKVCSIT